MFALNTKVGLTHYIFKSGIKVPSGLSEKKADGHDWNSYGSIFEHDRFIVIEKGM